MTADYKNTVFLPATDFPMKAGLPDLEPKLLARWKQMDLYGKMREQAKAEGRPQFVLHDGPPYANGHLHLGHALNKILKDFVVKSQRMTGKDAPYVPGWDCHGLPIEWKIEERYREAGRDKDEVDPVEFRRECREFAAGWIDVQREEFQRLGVAGEWNNPYTTMAFTAEAQIVRELSKFVMQGDLIRAPSRSCGRWSRRPRWPKPKSNITTTPRSASGCASRSRPPAGRIWPAPRW